MERDERGGQAPGGLTPDAADVEPVAPEGDVATGGPIDATASGGFGSGSELGSSGGSPSGGENLTTGSATEFMRGGANALDERQAAREPSPREDGQRADEPDGAPDQAIPPDVAGE